MILDFILDEDYLAFSILIRKMYKEKASITDFKNKLRKKDENGKNS